MLTNPGLEKGIVRLEAHSPKWNALFEGEKQRILRQLDRDVSHLKVLRDLQHIGSTAIPGIAAKPILDIGLAVSSFRKGYLLVLPLEELGYEFYGENGVPNRLYFNLGFPTSAHLHLFELGSFEWQAHILFRDYLIAHPQAAAQYEQLKQELAARFRTEREKYTDGKAEFIRGVVELAKQEQATAR